MSDTDKLRSDNYLTSEQLQHVLELGRSRLSEWEESWMTESQFHFSCGQDVSGVASVIAHLHPTEFELSGVLQPDDKWSSRLVKVVTEGYPPISRLGTLNAQCYYNEIESRQQFDSGDSIGLFVEPERLYFSYRANGSKVSLDDQYRKAVIQDLIDIIGVPISIVYKGDAFFLTHLGSGILWISQSSGLRGKNPSGFRCEIKGYDLEDLLVRMRQFLAKYSSSLFSCTWRLLLRSGDLSNYSSLLAASIRPDVYLADRYTARLAIDSLSIYSLEQIGANMKAGDEATIQLGSFSDVNGRQYQLDAVINQDGIKIEVSSDQHGQCDALLISTALETNLRSFSQ
jgi:hypothetical protein